MILLCRNPQKSKVNLQFHPLKKSFEQRNFPAIFSTPISNLGS